MPRQRTKPAIKKARRVPRKVAAGKPRKVARPATRRVKRTKRAAPPIVLPPVAPHVARALAYARGVVAGEVLAGSWTRKACERHLRDLRRQGSAEFPYQFESRRAERFCHFAELLSHYKGPRAGQLFVLEDWQCFVACVLFGWLQAGSAIRRFRRFYLEVARGNGKSFFLAVMAIYMLALDGESGAEVYSAATTRDQAKIVFKIAQEIVRRCPDLRSALGIDVQAHSIVQQASASAFIALSADDSSMDGLNTHFACIDELHAHKTRGVHDVLETSIAKRLQSLLAEITTAGADRNGICYEVRTDLTNVLNGTATDESFFGVIYTIDDEDDWKDERNWRKANPNLDVSVNLATLRDLARKAERTPAAQNAFKTKHLNVWVTANAALYDVGEWIKLGSPDLDREDVAASGAPCIIACDLAGKNDFSERVEVFRETGEDGKDIYTVFAAHYTNRDFVEDARIAAFPGWDISGWLQVSPGSTIDQETFAVDTAEAARQVNLVELDIDVNFQGLALAQRLQREGLVAVDCPQTVKQFNEATTLLETLIREGRIRHNGDPVLAWMIGNVVGHYDAKDNVFPRKERNDAKIDGAIGIIMALSRWRNQVADQELDECPISIV